MKIKFNFKYIVYIFFIIFLYYCFNHFNFLNYFNFKKSLFEGYESNYFNQSNESSKTVDLPLTFPFSCKNFCGPKNTCAITGEQCSNDYDCTGCENMDKLKPPKVEPYYLELSPNNNSNMDSLYVGSKNNLTPQYYSQTDKQWIKTFNEAIKMYNERQTYNAPLDDFEKKIQIYYPQTVSATGEFYSTIAPAYNN